MGLHGTAEHFKEIIICSNILRNSVSIFFARKEVGTDELECLSALVSVE
jgi:hypothetical protein